MEKTHKKVLIIAGAAIGATPLILIMLAYTGLVLFVVSGAFAIFMPEPAEPLIKYGEFPFSITYEMNNEVITYEDVIICEYEGWEDHGTGGKVRKWSKRLKSGNKDLILLDVSNQTIIDEDGYRILYLYLYFGNAEFYMNDIEYHTARSPNNGDLYINCVKQLGDTIAHTMIPTEKAYEEFGLRIIDVSWATPINNAFG